MNIKFILISLVILIFPIICRSRTKDYNNTEFVKQLTHLEVFTRDEKRINSLREKYHRPIFMSFEIATLKIKNRNIALARVYFDKGTHNIMLFTVRFDRAAKKVLSVKKSHLGNSLAEYGWTDKTE